MVKSCNPSMNQQDLMNTANKEWRKYRKESETTIKNQIKQYLIASPSIVRTTTFFLPPNLPNIPNIPNIPSSESSTSDSATQHKSSTLIREAEAKITEYEHLMANTSNKDLRQLEEKGIVEIFATRGHPSEFQKNPELLDQIHECIEYGTADKKRRKTTIKVPNVKIVAVSQSEMNPHIDEHYCLASVKMVREFASTFANHSIIISQDDKAKIGLGIPAVSRTFRSLQSFNEPVTVSDHNFPHRAKQKLIPSVYLIINPEDTNESLRQVDEEPDENPRHLKNIIEYCRFFCKLDLDYFSIYTHAPSQSAYNPVKYSMCTLSEKLAGIELPIDKFGSHLNSWSVVIDEDLARYNFEFAGQYLCEIWKCDNINGKQVYINYVDHNENPFQNNEKDSIIWLWIECHIQICHYSLNVRKCSNQSCCDEVHAKEAIDLLKENNRFLLPLMKGKDGHYLNLIHILQYMDK
ncbi:7001_t:CDS:2, partial [Gigaspora margarita]